MYEIRASKAPGEIEEFLPKTKSKNLSKTKRNMNAEALTIFKQGKLKKKKRKSGKIAF